jgi:hypothetical protein
LKAGVSLGLKFRKSLSKVIPKATALRIKVTRIAMIKVIFGNSKKIRETLSSPKELNVFIFSVFAGLRRACQLRIAGRIKDIDRRQAKIPVPERKPNSDNPRNLVKVRA